MTDSLLVKEIYYSLQGESTWAGLPCIFVRLTGCDLRCSYCDSVFAFRGGQTMNVDQIVIKVHELAENASGNRPLVEVTGGEPLLQRQTPELLKRLAEEGYQVLLETSGAHPIESVPSSVCRIVDLKCPSSGENGRILWANLDHLTERDELKFVIATREDYEWAREVIADRGLVGRCALLFSGVEALTSAQSSPELKAAPEDAVRLSRQELAEHIIRDRLPVRFQLQMHKFIWEPERQGV